jgi:ferrochelatase
MSAHSIPVSMAAASRYVEQVTESSRRVAEALGRKAWRLAFQSRSGSPLEPWLEPDIGEVLRGLEGPVAVVVPIGFLCDHVEVLYDLDIEAARIAREAGVRMERAPSINDHPRFIEMMASVVHSHLGR